MIVFCRNIISHDNFIGDTVDYSVMITMHKLGILSLLYFWHIHEGHTIIGWNEVAMLRPVMDMAVGSGTNINSTAFWLWTDLQGYKMEGCASNQACATNWNYMVRHLS